MYFVDELRLLHGVSCVRMSSGLRALIASGNAWLNIIDVMIWGSAWPIAAHRPVCKPVYFNIYAKKHNS